MKRHIVCHPVIVAVVLSVCLMTNTGPVALANQGGAPNEGTPRVMYTTAFVPGTRVVLLDNDPAGGPGLKAGMSGTIICCDKSDCSGRVLVSWNTWRGGRNEEASCVSAVAGLYPDGSTIWVDPSKVRLGLAFEGMGVLEGGPEDCLYLSTHEGKRYHLVVGPEFRKQWMNVLPGAFFRVRGLLNASKPLAGQTCPQADGDVYHPILTPTDWDLTPGSWAAGPFFNAERVVLVGDANPNGATGLPRGATGTLICHNTFEKENSYLVSWDLWDKGGDPYEYLNCTQRFGGLFPPGSTWWVSARDIAKYFESDCGTLEETLICCRDNSPTVPMVGLIVPLGDVFCLPDIATGKTLPKGLYKAAGLWTPYEELIGRQTPANPAKRTIGGIIFDSVVMPCPAPSCCEPPYATGDRVRLLVNQPGGKQGLAVGIGGTVLCCNQDDPVTPILVAWDDWTGIGDDEKMCPTPTWLREKAGVWMACTEIRRVTLADLCDKPEFRSFLPQTIGGDNHLRISGMIYNSGGADSGPFFVNIYLSKDAQITTDDYQLSHTAMDIGAGGSVELSWLNPIPNTIPAGKYYVGWLIDPDNRVVEEDETNNMVVIGSGQLTWAGK